LEEFLAAGNLIGAIERMTPLSKLPNLRKVRFLDRLNNLSNPVCHLKDYHASMLKLLPHLLVLDG